MEFSSLPTLIVSLQDRVEDNMTTQQTAKLVYSHCAVAVLLQYYLLCCCCAVDVLLLCSCYAVAVMLMSDVTLVLV